MASVRNDINGRTQFRELGIGYETQASRDFDCVNVKSLKEVLAEKIFVERENVSAFRESHGSTIVGEVTVDMARSLITFSLKFKFD